MGLLLLTGLVLMLISSMLRWTRDPARRWAACAWTAAASVVVLVLVLSGRLPPGC